MKVEVINTKRAESNYKEKTLPETIEAFTSINYLLDKVKMKAPALTQTQCPPLDADGKPAIDSKSLRILDECLKHEPDTKLSNSILFISDLLV